MPAAISGPARGPLRAGERLPPDVSDPQPGHRDRPLAGIYRMPGAAVASPSRTRSSSSSAMKPCANIIASVQPCGDPASSRSVRRSATRTINFFDGLHSLRPRPRTF
jgi:hypothetical protein